MLAIRVFFQCLLFNAAIASVIQPTPSKAIFAAKPTGLDATTSQILPAKFPPTDFTTSKTLRVKNVARTHEDAPSPTQPGLISTCNAYYLVKSGDYCDTVVSKFGNLTLSEFYLWNPAVKSDCSELLAGYYVCIGASDTSASSSTASITAAGIAARSIAAAPKPTQSGIVSNCNKYYEVSSGDSCVGIANNYDIPLSQFYSWNPAVGNNCQTLLAGYYVCVGVSDDTTTPLPTITSTTSPVPAPTPTQSGITSDCTEYYKAQSGDTCISIVGRYTYLTLATFENWNPAVGNDCQSLLAGYYYCVATQSVHG